MPFRPLGELLGAASPHAGRPAAWIQDRGLLNHRKWSPATMAALHVAREAIQDAGWGPDELRDAALVVGTSRGNAAGWLGPWPGRRPFKLMAASNTIHSEPASAISIEFGMAGPSQVIASGCAAGLDAIGVAMMMVTCGLAERALAVAVDLPLVPMLLDNYAASGLLSPSALPDPYHASSCGFIPGEGAGAMTFEAKPRTGAPLLLHYSTNSDAADPVGIPRNGGNSARLIRHALETVGSCRAISPHATGTAVQGKAEPVILNEAFDQRDKPSLHPLKPFLGHTIGASGLLESVILARFLRDGQLPPTPDHLQTIRGFTMPGRPIDVAGPVFKLSHGMGGHNSLLVFSP